jgi:hypothetical protein
MARMWEKYGAVSELAFVNLAMDNLSYAQYIEVIEAVGPEGVRSAKHVTALMEE